MKKISLIIIFLAAAGFGQQKYWIFFSDKGVPPQSVISGSPEYEKALSFLSEKSLERRKKVMGENFITYDDLPVNQAYIDSLQIHGIRTINVLKWENAVTASLTNEQIQNLSSASYIKKIERVRTYISVNPSNGNTLSKAAFDSLNYGLSFTQLKLCDVPVVHNSGITGKGVLLGILDTGFKWKTHEALSGAHVIAEYDFIFRDSITENQTGDAVTQQNHGTTVFSVIAGKKDSVLLGGAFDADFLLAKTEDVRSETRVEEDNYAAALEWMENYGVDITTSSLGYSDFDNFTYTYADMNGKTTIVTKAAELAFSRGVFVITAAGNEGNTPWHYITAPADGFNVLAVGAVDDQDRVAGFSSKGPTSDGRIKPDVVAMGVSVFGATAVGENMYGSASGTSLATPIVAGCSALLLSAFPYLSNVQLRDIMIRTAANYKYPDNDRGYGLVSAQNAVEYPNIMKGGTVSFPGYFINKIFLDEPVAAPKIFISRDGQKFMDQSLSKDTLFYSFRVPETYRNQVIKFYFEYIGNKGNTIRVPSQGLYVYTYGDNLVKEASPVAQDYLLSNNFPNPFNNSTRINFVAEENTSAELVIYDAIGQKVKTLFSAQVEKGEYSILWDSRADNGMACASGIYFYYLKIGGKESTKKMILLK